MSLAVYPGTFDPVTYGHLDVLKRASRLFDEVIIAVADNPAKGPMFTFEERVKLVEDNIRGWKGVRVMPLGGLVVDFARANGASALIRGLRAISDFEYEFQMAQMNRNLDGEVETIFLMPSEKYFYTSSQLIKQVARYTGRETGLVPPNVVEALRGKFGTEDEQL